MMVHVLFRPVHVVDGNYIIFYFQRVIYNILSHEFFTSSHSYKGNTVVWNISPVFSFQAFFVVFYSHTIYLYNNNNDDDADADDIVSCMYVEIE